MRTCAFFPPSLPPGLDGGKGDQDAVVTPEVPVRRAVRHTVLDHEPSRQSNHTGSIRTAGWGELREVRVTVLAALRTVGRRLGDHESPRTPPLEMPPVVQRPLGLLVPRGLGTTTRTGLARGGAPSRDELWRGPVCTRGPPFGGSGSIRPRTAQGGVLRARLLRPALYDQCPSGAIPKPGNNAIVSENGPFSNCRY